MCSGPASATVEEPRRQPAPAARAAAGEPTPAAQRHRRLSSSVTANPGERAGIASPASGPGAAMPRSRSSQALSEKRGLRQGLVHSRPGGHVFDFYEKQAVVGSGMTGKVYAARNRATGELFALKSMDKSRIDADLLADLRNEIEVLKMMDHPHVVKLLEYFEDESNIYLILELAEGGELFDRLHEQQGSHYSEAEAARLVFKFCAAISYIHHRGVTHRDLKLENFVFETKQPDSNVKLIDFGLSSKYGSSFRRMNTLVGTPYYIAPEVLDVERDGGRSAAQAAAPDDKGAFAVGLDEPDADDGAASPGPPSYTNACDCWSL
jgi:serine/threonine protein kinase